jgi:hypothetical protein
MNKDTMAKYNLFPFTLTHGVMGLTALWIKYREPDLSWTNVSAKLLDEKTVEFEVYEGFGVDQYVVANITRQVDPEDIKPYIEDRKRMVVNQFFRDEEEERERQRVAKRKEEIYNQLF